MEEPEVTYKGEKIDCTPVIDKQFIVYIMSEPDAQSVDKTQLVINGKQATNIHVQVRAAGSPPLLEVMAWID